jgi:tetratricopeptide (TPR) repeat protein
MIQLRMAVLALAVLALVGGCRSESRLPDERNPFYRRGCQLREQSAYDKAAEAFEKALRLAPNSVKTHLQLALLYDDHLGDPVRAIMHYRVYLEKQGEGGSVEAVRTWLTRCEKRLLDELSARYADSQPEEDAPVQVTERERQLVIQLKRLSEENTALRRKQELATRLKRPKPSKAKTAANPPATPEAKPPEPPEEKIYVVQKGDNLSVISKKMYGTSAYSRKLQEVNTAVLSGGDRLLPGMRLRIPPLERMATPPKRR